MNFPGDWLVQNRASIDKTVEIMGQAAEVLAVTVGQLHPILEAAFFASAELLGNPDGKEARYIAQQFNNVNRQLEGIQHGIDQIALELQRTLMNKQNFFREGQMLSQYEKFQDFVNSAPNFKKKKMEKFIIHYENTQGELNLDALYNAVIGSNSSREPILETLVATEQRSRRAVEEFCARLKKLFVFGIIAVLGYTALKGVGVGVVAGEEIMKKWQKRMEDVEERMKAAVDECTEKFADQAKLDLEHLVTENPGTVNQEFVKSLLDSLIKKYDWVNWSIKAFNEKERFFFFNWLAGKKYQGIEGANWFDVLTNNRIKVVVSFCVRPKPINKNQIQEQIEGQKLKGNMMDVALSLKKCFPDLLVHSVSYYKYVVETNNFHEDCYYYGKHQQAYLCIHP